MLKQPTITFVTAFIDLNEDRNDVRTPEKYVLLFKQLASSGISICLYVCSKYESTGLELQKEFKNVKLMPITNLEDTKIYNLINSYNPDIPIVTNIKKDTKQYMILMNTKSEFVYNATLRNPFNTEYFAWIDFGICHIMSNPDNSLTNLYNLSNSKLKDKLLVFPSCWSRVQSNLYINTITSIINWRFCGGIYIGDINSIREMHLLILSELGNYITQSGKNIINWEVNFWAWLENKCNWKIDTYHADHNDSILNVPNEYIIDDLDNLNDLDENINITNFDITNFDITKYIDKVFYINLEHRTDRKHEIEDELNNYNIPYERFNAFATPDFGIVGCTKSHLEVLKEARDRKYKNILIFEDDFKFIVSRKEFEKNIKLLFETKVNNDINDINENNINIQFDICMLSYNLINGEICNPVPFLTKVLEVQTASGYIVNESIYNRLIELYEYALPLLESTRQHWIYANDQIWKTLQPNSNWYCFTERIGIQRPSYSDNSKTLCNLGC